MLFSVRRTPANVDGAHIRARSHKNGTFNDQWGGAKNPRRYVYNEFYDRGDYPAKVDNRQEQKAVPLGTSKRWGDSSDIDPAGRLPVDDFT